jgi:hypothetical protein
MEKEEEEEEEEEEESARLMITTPFMSQSFGVTVSHSLTHVCC